MNIVNDAILRERYGSENGYLFEELEDGIKMTIRNNPEGPWPEGTI